MVFDSNFLKNYFLPEKVRTDSCTLLINGKKKEISILRLDLIHPIRGGNKGFKLYRNVIEFYEGKYKGMISAGGTFSNHIAALAEVGMDLKIPVAAFIRGEASPNPSPTIKKAMEAGMEMIYLTREEYRILRNDGANAFINDKFKEYYFIPEGGSNKAGLEGCAYISRYIPAHFSHILLAVGTGTTLAGIASQLDKEQELIGVKVVEAKQEIFVSKALSQTNASAAQLKFCDEFTFGGYAKKSLELEQFVENWNEKQQVLIEPVYTGRLFYGLTQMLQQNYFPENANILLIHSGGRQYLDH